MKDPLKTAVYLSIYTKHDYKKGSRLETGEKSEIYLVIRMQLLHKIPIFKWLVFMTLLRPRHQTHFVTSREKLQYMVRNA